MAPNVQHQQASNSAALQSSATYASHSPSSPPPTRFDCTQCSHFRFTSTFRRLEGIPLLCGSGRSILVSRSRLRLGLTLLLALVLAFGSSQGCTVSGSIKSSKAAKLQRVPCMRTKGHHMCCRATADQSPAGKECKWISLNDLRLVTHFSYLGRKQSNHGCAIDLADGCMLHCCLCRALVTDWHQAVDAD